MCPSNPNLRTLRGLLLGQLQSVADGPATTPTNQMLCLQEVTLYTMQQHGVCAVSAQLCHVHLERLYKLNPMYLASMYAPLSIVQCSEVIRAGISSAQFTLHAGQVGPGAAPRRPTAHPMQALKIPWHAA